MAQLPADYADRVQQVLGQRMGDLVRRQANDARSYMVARAADFTVNGSPLPLSVSPDDPVTDLGGSNRNEAMLSVPLSQAEGTPLAAVVADSVGFAPAVGSSATFFVHRTLDPGVSASRQLGTAEFAGVIFSAISASRDQLQIAVVDGQRARVLVDKPRIRNADNLRRYFESNTPQRTDRFDADLGHVYRRSRGVITRVPIRDASPMRTPYPITDGFTFATRTTRLSLGRATEQVGPADARDDAADQKTIGQSEYAVVTSGLSASDGNGGIGGGGVPSSDTGIPDPPIIITGSNSPITDRAPAGFVWGDPGNIALCSRESQDGCLGCCQAISNRYYGAAATTFASGAVTSLGAVAGIVTIPVAWAPVAIGAGIAALMLIGGLIHGSICEKDCRTLYDRTTGDSIKTRRFELRSAEEESGEQVAYRGEVILADGTRAEVRIPRPQLMAFVWGGAVVAIPTGSGAPAFVSLARRPGGEGLYLRSSRDRRVTNNLRELPAFRG